MATQVLDWGREHDPQGRPGPELRNKNGDLETIFWGVGWLGSEILVFLDFFLDYKDLPVIAFGIPLSQWLGCGAVITMCRGIRLFEKSKS